MAHEKKAEDILINHCPVFDPLFADAATYDHKTRITKAMFEFANYMVDLNVQQQAQQEIFNNNIIEQLQIRVEQDIAKIQKLQDDARDQIKLMGWISVRNRLPKDDNLVIVTNIDDKDNLWVCCGYYRRSNRKWYNQFEGPKHDADIIPTHWMPLPEVPNE